MVKLALAPVTPRTFEQVIAHLPAEVRAKLHWAPNGLAKALRRLHTEALEIDVLLDVCTTVLHESQVFFAFLGQLSADELSRVDGDFASKVSEMEERLKRLPGRIRAPSLRAFYTAIYVSALTLHLVKTQRAAVAQMLESAPEALKKLSREDLHLVAASVVTVSLLDALEGDLKDEARLVALARKADELSEQVARSLATLNPNDPRAYLPWYLEAPGQPAEWKVEYGPLRTSAPAARALLARWAEEPSSPEEERCWSDVKRSIDTDRLSDRPLFP